MKRLALYLLAFILLAAVISPVSAGFTPAYPPVQNATYVTGLSLDTVNYAPWFATDPSKPVTGSITGNTWVTTSANGRMGIDYGTNGAIATLIYYEPFHHLGTQDLNYQLKHFNLYGSNSSTVYSNTTVGNYTTGMTLLETSTHTFAQHVASNVADPHYINVTNTVAYRYYVLMWYDTYGESFGGIRHIELWESTTDAPAANFTNITPLSGILPHEVSFTDTSLYNPTSWIWMIKNDTGWSGGNGTWLNVNFTQNATIVFPVGNWDVKLNATNAGGSNISVTTLGVNATVPHAITANFSIVNQTGPSPLLVTFTDTSDNVDTNIDTWHWTFGDGTVSSLQNPPEHTYTINNSYSVNLTITNASYSLVSIRIKNISVLNSLPTSFFTMNQTSGDIPLAIEFTDTSLGSNISTYMWDFGDGNTSLDKDPVYTYRGYGEFTVNHTVINDGGADSSYHNVTVVQFGNTFTGTPLFGLVPLDVSFTGVITGGILADSYYWEFGDGGTSALQSPTHTYTAPGTWDVSFKATNGTMESWFNRTGYVKTELANITASFTASNTSTYDPPLVVRFADTTTSTNATPLAYLWDFGDSSSSTDQNPLHSYPNYGTYLVKLTAYNTSSMAMDNATTPVSVLSVYDNNSTVNIQMNGVYLTTIVVKDSATLAVINNVLVNIDSAPTSQTESVGAFTRYFEYGSHTFNFQSEGYGTKTTSLFIGSAGKYTVTMDALSYTVQQNLNVLYPHETTFTIVDANGNRLPGVNVTMVMVNTTITGNWWNTLFGISTNIAPEFESTRLYGVTDDYGKIAFPCVSSAVYEFVFADAALFDGGYVTKRLTPDQTAITIVLPTIATATPANSADYISSDLSTINSGATVYLNMSYVDASHTTTDITFYIRFPNQTIYYTASYSGASVLNTSRPVTNIAGDAYVWGYSANNTRFGWQNQSAGITLKGVTGIVYNPLEYKGHW